MTDLLSLGIWIVKNIFRIYFTVFLNCLVLFVCFIFAFFLRNYKSNYDLKE